MLSTHEVPVSDNRGVRAAAGRVFGLTFLPVWGASGTLAVCLFLPMFLLPGCQIQGGTPGPPTPITPYELYEGQESPRDVFYVTALFQWPYFFGLLVWGATLFIAVTGQARHFRALWFAFAGLIVISSIGLWWHTGDEFREQKNAEPLDMLGEILIVVVPTILFCLVLVATYFNCRTWLAAATWVQLTLAAYGLAWFTLVDYSLYPLLWGGRLSQAACLTLAVATLVERRRAFKTLGVQ